jgi:probable poly-beta-1,6-N-acetyl-D-glucosamine export protein
MSYFQQHIHVFRGIAISLIVCAHTLPSLDWSHNPMTGRWLDAVANQSSILFFFIAGYLFQYLSPRFSFGPYMKQKFRTVIVPYLILSVPALFVFVVLVPRQSMWPFFYELPGWQQIVLFILTGKHLAPLWFVPTITLFYLAAPLFIWLDRRWPRGYWLIVPLLGVSTYVGRGGQWGPLNFAYYLLAFYMLGMAVSRYRDTALMLIKRWRWPLLITMVLGICGFALEWPDPPHWQVLCKTPMALLLTLFLKHQHHRFGHRLDEIADLSFGIFFVHAYLILALKLAAVYILEGRIYAGVGEQGIPGNLMTFALYALTVMLLSVWVLRLVKHLLGDRSRMLVGA